MGLRQQKAIKLQAIVIAALVKLTAKKSFDDVFVDHICQEAGISKVTMFKYFKDKDGLLLAWWEEWCDKIKLGSSLELVDEVYTMYQHRPTLMEAAVSAVAKERAGGRFQKAIEYRLAFSFPKVKNGILVAAIVGAVGVDIGLLPEMVRSALK